MLARLFLLGWIRARGNRSPADAVLALLALLERESEEDAARERLRQAIRQAEVRIRLAQRRRNPLQPGRHDHRPGHVSAAAEDDIRLSPAEYAQAREGSHQR